MTTSDFDRDAAKRDADPSLLDGDDVGEELTVQETIIVEERDPERLKSLLTGLPSPSSLAWTLTTLLINIALALMVADYTYRATYLHPSHDLSFARVGYVSDATASILVREPKTEQYPLFASYRHADPPHGSSVVADWQSNQPWKSAGRIDWADNRTDFTGHITFGSLKPDTKYQYTVSNNHTGYFVTSPRRGQISTRHDRHGKFTFLHTSCLKNNFPYNPFAHPLANQGLRYLADVLGTIEAQFMIFLGDFIYVDVPHRHGLSVAEDYRREYRQVYASPDWPAVSKNLPWIHVYDDHEISNDWDKNTTGYFTAANDPYEHYHTSVNPPTARTRETYFSFVDGPASFFILDTRRYRSPNDKTNGSDPLTGEPTKSMLGKQQLADLLAWLERPERSGVRWKVVISSVPFTKNWWFGAQDTWRGYLGERQIILEAMWDVGARGDGVGVVILSGDRHEFAATAFPPPPDGVSVSSLGPIAKAVNKAGAILAPDQAATRLAAKENKRWPAVAVVHEFSASPLNMFYLPTRTYKESSTDDRYVSDVCIKYIPDGNSKFGAVSISAPSTSEQSILHYRLFVDGKEKWSYTITTPPRGGNELKYGAIWG